MERQTRWVGVALYALGGGLRLWPVFVLGQSVQRAGRHSARATPSRPRGIYGLIRNPSYLGMLINMLGWGLAFRGWSGIGIALLLLVPLVARIRAEERLLRSHFGAEYDAYCERTWRLVPWIY